jgi:hypothetical protein
MQDQWLQIPWSETGKESDRAICFPLRITLGWPCLGGPPLLLSQVSQSLLTGMSHGNGPEALQQSGFLQELTIRELIETLEFRYDKFAGTLKVMGEEGGLIRRRKGRQKMLWSPGEDGNLKQMNSAEKPPETGSQTIRKSERHRNRLDSITTIA